MRYPILFIGLFILCGKSYCQQVWVWQNPFPQGNDLRGVYFTDETHGTAVGAFGTIIYTTDFGNSWRHQESGTHLTLNNVFFTDERTGVIVGDSGIILKTENTGETWTLRESTVTSKLNEVTFYDSQHGIAVGNNVILLTTDGGERWSVSDTSQRDLNAVTLIGKEKACVVGASGTVLITSDTGKTWEKIVSPHIKYTNLNDVFFPTASIGIATGAKQLFRTSDGGMTWTSPEVFSTLNKVLAVHFANDTLGAIAGDNDRRRTTNAGRSWVGSGIDGTERAFYLDQYDIQFVNDSTAISVGDLGTVTRTFKAAKSWQTMTTHLSRIREVDFSDERNGVAVGNGPEVITHFVLHTTDGGWSWERVSDSLPPYGSSGAVHMIDSLTVFIAGRAGAIYQTTDAAKTWSLRSSGVGHELEDIDFLDNIGAIVGSNDTVLWTTDLGVTWNKTSSKASVSIHSIDLVSPTTAFIAGDSGNVLRTIDGGQNWTRLPTGTRKHLYKIRFTDQMTGNAVGDNGMIIRTTDGGDHWQIQNSGVSVTLTGVSYLDSEHGVTVGNYGLILYTSNGGESWTEQKSNTYQTLLGVCRTGNAGWTAVGDEGTILHTPPREGHARVIPEKNVDAFMSVTSYPNPASRFVNIEFAIDELSDTKITLVNPCDQEVLTVVEQNSMPGNHKVKINTDKLPNGVYFYQVKTKLKLGVGKFILVN